jgi:hypothetical protein
MIQKTEIITPERAAFILANKNTRNRPLSLYRAKIYAEDMMLGLWGLNHQGIAFYPDGILADGQTRLKAVVMANVPIKMSVSYQIEDGSHIDGGGMRSMKDSINLSDEFYKNNPITQRNVALIRIEWGTSVTIDQAACFFEKHILEFEFLNSLPKTTLKNGQLASVHLAILKAVSNDVNKGELREFYEVYLTGACKNESQWAAVRLRNHILESKKSDHNARVEYNLKAQFAIKCFIERKAIHKILKPEHDIYPI